MNWPTPRRSASIARIEYRRSIRAVLKNPMQLLALGFVLLLFVGGPTVGGAYVAYKFGGNVSDSDFLVDAVRGGFAVGWFFLAFMVASRAVGKTGRIDHEPGMLTTVPARDVAGGLVLAELARFASAGLLPILSISVAWCLALGTPAPLVTIVFAVIGMAVTALLTGHILGLLLKTLLSRSELLAQHKSTLVALGFALYIASILSGTLDDVTVSLASFLQTAPTAWFGDLLLAGVPGVSASLPRIGGAVAFVAVGLPILLALDVRTATRLWYSDRVQPENKRYESSESNVDFLARFVSRPTRTVTANVWRRTKRAPLRLIYVMYPIFFITAPVQETVQTGTVSEFLAYSVAIYGTWAVGASALNPFGDEGAMLPVTLTSTIRGEQFVRGHTLAATLVGLPFVVVATVVVGVLSPLKPAAWISLTGASVLLGMAGTVVAIGIGTLFPRFGEVRISRSRHVVVPSKTAFIVYTLVLFAGYFGALIAFLPEMATIVASVIGALSSFLGFPVMLDPETLRIVGGAVALLLGVAAPPLAYRYTVREFDSYVLD